DGIREQLFERAEPRRAAAAHVHERRQEAERAAWRGDRPGLPRDPAEQRQADGETPREQEERMRAPLQPRLLEQALEVAQLRHVRRDRLEPLHIGARHAAEQRVLRRLGRHALAQRPLELPPHRTPAHHLAPPFPEQRERDEAQRDGKEDQARERPGARRDVYHRSPTTAARVPTSANSAAGSTTPYAFSRSVKRGRIPVARNCPRTLPRSSNPWRSKTKMSCIVMTSPSIPTISEMVITLRVPSESRASWITTLIALAICWRMPRSGRLSPAMEIMVSRRLNASRGELECSVVSEPSWPVFIAW